MEAPMRKHGDHAAGYVLPAAYVLRTTPTSTPSTFAFFT